MATNQIVSIVLLAIVLQCANSLNLVSRDGWGAKPPKSTQWMANPVPYVIIHHSASPPACYTESACVAAMQSMQNYHQINNGWVDIGYNFAVGGDGRAYVGRGWDHVGAHAPNYNSKSIGICVIGDWTSAVPPTNQQNAIHELIQLGVSQGHISANYKLLGHRQVTDTSCPGNSFYSAITKWSHYSPSP